MYLNNQLSILIPYKQDNGQRDKNFKWVIRFYKQMMPKSQICIGESRSRFFSRSEAINRAARKANGNIFMIVDGDIICNPNIIKYSVQLLSKHNMIIPYKKIQDLSKESTHRLLNMKPAWPLRTPLKTAKRKATSLGGLNILPRKTFEAVQGFDERFIGWGGEDDAFACSVDTIVGGRYRLNADIFHLWHPKNHRHNHPYYNRNAKLANRYCNATGNVTKIKKIINER